jgi:hypothetical protein
VKVQRSRSTGSRRVALLACVCAVASACGQGSATFAQSHAPTGAPTVLVAIGDYGLSGSSGSFGDHQDWAQLFYGESLSRRSTLYDLSSPAGSYVEDLLDGEDAQAVALHPDLVAVWVGVPDLLDGMPAATFGSDLEQVLTRLDAGRARVLVANVIPVYDFPDYRSCEAAPLACGLPGALPTESGLAVAVSSYDLAISRAAADGRAAVVDLTGAFTHLLAAAGSSASSAVVVDRSDLGLTPAGEEVVAGAFESAFRATRR